MNRKLRLFKQAGNLRLPYVIEVDATLTIVAEGFEGPVAAAQEEPGYTYTVGPDGSRIISGVSQRERTILDFFIPTAPCPNFPGCAALRAEYEAEVAEMGGDCTDCDRSQIMRKFRERILPHLP